ncbi:hypothetical protein CMV_025380 [Castanea mollissima]|uniref:Uncharacterized protein n=1 Tax=Castanea mollissima TaxID=60419 RepID=A0A8J4Q9E5_9ROSI|nr:hypothetical protein CMV_025380 [Castanea mollissima]
MPEYESVFVDFFCDVVQEKWKNSDEDVELDVKENREVGSGEIEDKNFWMDQVLTLEDLWAFCATSIYYFHRAT